VEALGRGVVALLRGVNIGQRRLVMADLRRICEEAGLGDVWTYVQSGNAVFTTSPQRSPSWRRWRPR